tara:strand:- start:45 stop:323 length:279 start_codon:yes stop_codon:yes gene_type:complete
MKLKYMKKMKEWFLHFVSGSVSDENAELKSRIKDAKNKVVWSEYFGLRIVENYEEVRLLIGYEDTLGMILFVRDYITDEKCTIDECVEYLLK